MSWKALMTFTALSLASTLSWSQSDLLLPDLKTSSLHLLDRKIDRDTIPSRKLLRFSNATPNIGKGRLELRGGDIREDGSQLGLSISMNMPLTV